MKNIIYIPKVQISLLLFLLFVLVAPRIGIALSLYLLISCLTFTAGSDLIFTYLRKKSLFVPHAAVVTALILALIIDTQATWYQMLVICVSAMAIKNFLRISGKHMLNPAASGLLVGFFVFGLQPSWWGPTFYLGGFTNPVNIAVFAVVLAFAYVSVKRMKRSGAVASYLVSASLFTFISSVRMTLNSLFSAILSPGVLFYGLLMLPEPMTSPANVKRQVLYGVFVSSAISILVRFVSPLPIFNGNFPDASLVALILGNIVFFRFR